MKAAGVARFGAASGSGTTATALIAAGGRSGHGGSATAKGSACDCSSAGRPRNEAKRAHGSSPDARAGWMELQSIALHTDLAHSMLSPGPAVASSRGDAFLSRLNDAQRRAALHGIGSTRAVPGPLLVIAGAGTGKTATLAARAACLVGAGTDPARILMLTFSRRAALDMERRVGRALQQAFALPATAAPPRLAWCGTFHSVGARLLRAYANPPGPGRFVHRRRSRRFGRRAASVAPAARARQRRTAISAEGDLRRDLLARRQQPPAVARRAGRKLPLVR